MTVHETKTSNGGQILVASWYETGGNSRRMITAWAKGKFMNGQTSVDQCSTITRVQFKECYQPSYPGQPKNQHWWDCIWNPKQLWKEALKKVAMPDLKHFILK